MRPIDVGYGRARVTRYARGDGSAGCVTGHQGVSRPGMCGWTWPVLSRARSSRVRPPALARGRLKFGTTHRRSANRCGNQARGLGYCRNHQTRRRLLRHAALGILGGLAPDRRHLGDDRSSAQIGTAKDPPDETYVGSPPPAPKSRAELDGHMVRCVAQKFSSRLPARSQAPACGALGRCPAGIRIPPPNCSLAGTDENSPILRQQNYREHRLRLGDSVTLN